MKKRILSLVTALALSLTVVPVSVLAAEEQGETVSMATAVDATALPSNDELFLGYIQQRMYSNPQLTPFSNYGESTGVLNDKELAVYRELKGKIQQVAAQGGSTEFALTTNLGISWGTTASGDALKTEAEQHFNTTIDMGKIVDCLLADCPYELYWFDKTEGYSTSYAISKAGNTATISDVNVTFMVANSYRSGNTTTVKSDVSTVSTAITNAKEIVAQYAAKTDYQKLKAYKDEICDLVSYNYGATNEGTPYGDPWQIIYVFDEDPDTKVVCEGYAKAFQYLCDLSDFTGNTTCYTVTGHMDGGPHMWNIVNLAGSNYLVDVTNCDEDSVGYPDKLFLKGYTSGDPTNGYTFSFDSSSITYTYDENTTELYSQEILYLTTLSYAPVVAAVTIDGNTTEYTSFQDAVSDTVGKTATITLLNDVTYGFTVYDENSNITFEGGEYTISSTGEDTVPVGVSKGSLTWASGTIESAGIAVSVGGTGCFTMTGGRLVGARYGLSDSIGGTAILTDGIITGGDAGVNINSMLFTMTGGTVESTGEESHAILVSGGTANISGGTVRATGTNTTGVYAPQYNGGSTEISGGEFYGTHAALAADSDQIVTLTGGTFYKTGFYGIRTGYKDDGLIVGNLLAPGYGYQKTIDNAFIADTNVFSINETVRVAPLTGLEGAAVTVSGTYTYNGQPQTPAVTVVKDDYTLTSSEYDLSYQQDDVSVDEPTDAGTYTVVVTGKGAYAGVAEASFTILPADYTYTKPTVETDVTVHAAYPAGGAKTATGVSGETVDGTLAWYLDDRYTQPANGTFEAAGSTTLYWKFTPATDETNYVRTAKTGSETFTVSDLPAQNVSFTDNDASDGAVDKIYGDASFTYAATSEQNGAITYESSATDVATVNSATGEVTIHGVGKATITATAAATDTHSSGSASYTLTVSPKGLTMTATAAGKIYDGTSNVTVTAGGALTGVVTGDTVSVAETSVTGTLNNPYVGTGKGITLDSDFTLTGEDAGKYTLTQPTVTGTVTAAADPAVIVGTATVKKDGNTVDLSENVTGAKGTVTYAVTDGEGTVDGSSGVYTSPADSGSATVTVTIADKDLNNDSTPEYTGKTATITVTITDKDTDTDSMTVSIAGWTYGETANAPVISGVSGGTATYSYSGTGDTSYASSSDAPTNAGTYRVDATYETNDTIYTASANFTIAKAESTLTAPTPISNLTYTGSAQNLINAGNATGGDMQYSLTGGNDYVAAIPTGVDAGTYTVWYKVIGDANHTDIAPASVTVTIAKAEPSCTAPTAEGATFGETLNDVALSGGTGDGTWAWKDSSVSVGNVGTNSFVAVFTPTDAQNYNTVEVNVTVTVQKADYAGETAVPATAVYNNTAQQTINLSQYLPAGCGTYTLTAVEGTDADNILAEVGQTGSSVTFKLTEGLTIDKAGKTATITATFVTENYNDIVLTVTVTLVEKEIYTVTFHANGGSGTMAAQTVEQGQSFTFPANGFTAPSGYRFKCWAYNSVAGNQYSVGATLTISANADIYAVWEIIPTTTPGNDNTYEPPYTPPASSNTEKNPDGSTTTTTTKPDGTVTETTKNPDGSKEVVETKKDGTVTTTTTDKTGNVTETVKNPDGSAVTTVENKDGSSSTTTVSENGKVESTVTLPKSVITDAAANYETVTLPMPAVSATTTRDEAPTVTVKLPAGTSAVVEIPVERVSTGTVAVLVKADGTEEIIKTSITTENGVTVSLSAGATVKIVDNTKYFSDVSVSYWGSDAIDFVTSRELFNGTSNDTFSPEATMNRAMIVTVLARLEDVDTSTGANWYDAGRQWAMETGISDGSDMDGSLTREQLAVMLYRYAGSPAVSGSFASYQDGAAVSAWANDAMLWTMEAGIITGISSDTIAPQNNAFRVQVATMLMRFIAMQ